MYEQNVRPHHGQRTARVGLGKELAQHTSAATYVLGIPLVLIPLTRGVLALVGALELRGISEMAALVVLISAAARVGYWHGRAPVPRASVRIAPLWSWTTVWGVVQRTPVTGLGTIGLAPVVSWPAACAAGTFLLLADLVLVKLNAHRVQRMLPGVLAVLRGLEEPAGEV